MALRGLFRTLPLLTAFALAASAHAQPRDYVRVRDGGALAPGTPVTYRGRLLATVVEALYYLATEPGTVVAGGNVWSWSGEGRPAQAGAHWRRGQPLTGDPPHDRQGWYAIHATDTTTADLTRTYASPMAAADRDARVTTAGARP